ncbi:hypothetical protein MRS44_017008 [Fusarium solani]|uniref:Azaphilone pigments biosynthesis cluster protein L N-terminal domain-containing protein n=1 Tax=Fusarium solani TaxID=169388 RepID=A0A9P9GSJ8_FUSSL|nr:uncharacterized protein B0J15DRAFT_501363 [Fusarium solani]KAH7243935.1 hypothetical protein B0J15DRAFT_501363 [Fusarium solani]KAJ3455526.1 hypothetical protein MRS44_017008 [Fusarium solani]
MTDPLSITASVIGIVGPALHVIRILINDIKEIRDAPKNLGDLLGDLELVGTALESVESIEEEQWKILGRATTDLAKATIKKTKETLEEVDEDLEKYSQKKKIPKWDRGILGFWKKKDLEGMSAQLHTCQGSITSLASTATLHSSIKNAETTNEMATMVSTSQDRINTSLTAVEQRLAEIERHLKEQRPVEVSLEPDAEDVSARAAREREELEAARHLLQSLLAQVQKVSEDAKKNKSGDRDYYDILFGGNNKGVQLGVNEGNMSGFRFDGA